MELQREADGLATVVFDHPGQKINTLDAAAIEALESLIGECERQPPAALLFLSGKDHFCMGADVTLIAALATRAEAEEGSRRGQALFTRLAALPCPTVIAVRGACLGGGLEWALACDRIVASDDRRTTLGLPEVKLGLIPGWGGTQRLPVRAGLGPAVEWIAAGRTLSAAEGLARGLVDRVVPDARLEEEARALARDLGRHRRKPRARRRLGLIGLAARWLPPVRRAVFRRVESEVARRAGPHYPAPRAAVAAVEARFALPMAAGMERERQLFADLAVSDVSRHLVRLWLMMGASRQWYAAEVATAAPVRRVAVLGAGVMGSGIARLAASRGLEVILREVAEAPLAAGMQRLRAHVETDRGRGRLTPADAAALLERVRPTLDLAEAADADVVIEAVVEDLDVKKRVLLEAALVAPGAVLATNTSALPIAAMAAVLPDPARLAGLHFFNPVHRMPLVEVVAPAGASPTTLGTLVALARRLDKTAIRVTDTPGFLVNRILSVYLREAMALLESGAPIEGVDRALTGFGMPLGPFLLLDRIGLDVAARVAATLTEAFGDRAGSPEPLERMLAAGRRGEKGGLGFYRHGGDGEPRPDAEGVAAILPPRTRGQEGTPAEWVDRLLDPMILEAIRCLDDGVVDSPDEIDLALVLGIGWPPFRGGLLRYADAIGAPALVTRLDRLSDQLGARVTPPGSLRERAARNARFHAP